MVRGYRQPPETGPVFAWAPSSKDTMNAIQSAIDKEWATKLVSLWSQEGNRSKTTTDVRMDHIYLIKHISE